MGGVSPTPEAFVGGGGGGQDLTALSYYTMVSLFL